jgi:predicted DsbA family dithiol-disulfide isomerase
MERDVDYNVYEMLARKYGMSVEQAKVSNRNVEQMAREVGLDFRTDTVILTNTFDAHRLVMYTKTQGKMKEMTDRILYARYTESKHIGDHETLTELAVEVGLNREAVAKMLASNDMEAEVRADEQEAEKYGIRSIPFFLINRKYAITGAQPTEAFVQALQKILKEEGPITILNQQDDAAACDDDGCEIPKK